MLFYKLRVHTQALSETNVGGFEVLGSIPYVACRLFLLCVYCSWKCLYIPQVHKATIKYFFRRNCNNERLLLFSFLRPLYVHIDIIDTVVLSLLKQLPPDAQKNIKKFTVNTVQAISVEKSIITDPLIQFKVTRARFRH